MCVIFFYVNSNPPSNGYKLILSSNRDEFYARETKPVSRWNESGHVYGGIDLEPGREGGTWLAIGGANGTFKVGAMLNLTGEPRSRKSVGRGMIVADYVKSTDECTIQDYNKNLLADCAKYSAFNFVSIEIPTNLQPSTAAVCSNVPPTLEYYREGKCYGFGNSLPSVPLKKVEHGQLKFEAIVNDFQNQLKEQSDEDASFSPKLQKELINNLMELLSCKEKFWPDEELKRRAPEWGMDLSALNVDIPNENYGSRTHTVILVDADNTMHFVEETMKGLNAAEPRLKTHFEIPYFKEQGDLVLKNSFPIYFTPNNNYLHVML